MSVNLFPERLIAKSLAPLMLAGSFVLGVIAPSQAQQTAPTGSAGIDLTVATSVCTENMSQLGIPQEQAKTICACTYDSLVKTHTTDELKAASTAVSTGGQPPAYFMEALQTCAAKVLPAPQ